MSYKYFILKLFSYLKPYFGKLIFATLAMAFATGLASLVPEIVGQIVDNLFMQGNNGNNALLYALALSSITVISSLFVLFSTAANSWVSNKVIMDLRSDLFAKTLKLPKSYFDRNSTGETLSKITFDVGQFASVSSSIWLEFVKNSIFVIVLVLYLFYKSWELSLSLVVVLPLVMIIVKLSSSRMRMSSRKAQQSIADMTHLLDENISGSSLIKIYNAQNQESKKFCSLVDQIRQQRFKVSMSSAFSIAFVKILIALSLSSVVYFSSIYLQMSAGDFLSYFTAMGMLSQPSKGLINVNKLLQIAVAAGESVFGLMDEEEENSGGKRQLKKVSTSIKFKNVFFSYEGQKNTLNGINLEIKKGQTVALVGSSGSGKTTIIQLLAKFYSVDSGSITIDDVNISEFNLDSLRSQIAFVDQNSRLFNDTIKANIALGRNDKMSNEEIENAAKLANAYDFIQKIDGKFDAQVGESGNNLSGGQCQRLSIARAVAKDSPILILDEATSALDSITEKQVQKAIFEMKKDKTTIIIAHRLSTIQEADNIIMLHHGEIVERGTHQELLDLNGSYTSFYSNQFS